MQGLRKVLKKVGPGVRTAIKGDCIPCLTEMDVFGALKLQYREPTDRDTFPYPEDYADPDSLDDAEPADE